MGPTLEIVLSASARHSHPYVSSAISRIEHITHKVNAIKQALGEQRVDISTSWMVTMILWADSCTDMTKPHEIDFLLYIPTNHCIEIGLLIKFTTTHR